MGEASTPSRPSPTVPALVDRILDTIADPLFVKDEEHRWIVVNDAFCAFMGHSRDEILGKSDFDFFPHSEAETFWKKDAEVFASGEININEEPFTDAAGETHVIITKKAVFTDAHGNRILVGIIRDVTELKETQRALELATEDLELRVQQRTREVEEAQARLRQAQKMEVVGQLTGGIAHDFNNLLAVVMGNLEVLLRRHKEDAAIRALTEPALQATRRGALLTQRLLAFSRQQMLKPQPVDVGHLVQDMIELLRRSLGEAVVIEVRTAASPKVAVVDATQLETAILNLAVNARDAMPEGGTLSISVDGLTVDDDSIEGVQKGPHVLLEVSDTGEGMTPEVLDRVFEPFFTTKGDQQGSGLGLSMVYGFIQQSKGHVSATSARGRGSVFRILLPESREAPDRTAQRPPETHDEPRGGNEHVLVVEDDASVRNMSVMLLRSLGYRVSEAASEAEALAMLPRLEALQLLLTDVVLGGRGRGDRLARQVEAERPDVRVLFMSGYPGHALEVPASEGKIQLLRKPFLLHDLAHAVRQALRS